MACLYLVLEKDDPQLDDMGVARTLKDAQARIKRVASTFWPALIVARISYVHTHEELVGLFNGQRPDLGRCQVLSLYRTTNRGALLPLDLPPDAAGTLTGVLRYLALTKPAREVVHG